MSEHGDLANRVDFVRRSTIEKKLQGCFVVPWQRRARPASSQEGPFVGEGRMEEAAGNRRGPKTTFSIM